MLKILFLILFVMSSIAFAQTQEKKDAYKFFEYEKISNKLLKEKVESFCNEVDKTSWIGWIISYGMPKEIAKREKKIRDATACSKEFPSPRIVFASVENKNESKTIFWIVPPKQESPIE